MLNTWFLELLKLKESIFDVILLIWFILNPVSTFKLASGGHFEYISGDYLSYIATKHIVLGVYWVQGIHYWYYLDDLNCS